MATRNKNTAKSDCSDEMPTYTSPLEKLCATVTKAAAAPKRVKSGKTVKSTSSSRAPNNSRKGSDVNNSQDCFKTKLIPLENGIDDNRYDGIPHLTLPSPPLPQCSPPTPPSPPRVVTVPNPQVTPSTSANSDHTQGMLMDGFKMMSKELGNTFADTMGRLNNSLLKGIEGLRDHMTSVSGHNEQVENYDDYDDEYHDQEQEHEQEQEMEEGEVYEREKEAPEKVQVNSLTLLGATIAKDEGLDAKVDDKLAGYVQTLMRNKSEEKMVGDLFTSIKQPANCSALSQVMVNPAIWEKMTQDGRSLDAKLQKVQLAITKGATEVTKMYDLLLTMARNGSEDTARVLEHGNSALVSLGAANVDLVQRRRDAIRPSFDTEYAHLFNHNTPFTNFLFGDDLSKNIKEITEDNKLLNNVIRTAKTVQRGKPYTRGQSSRGRGSYPRTRATRGRQGFGQDRPQPYRRPYPSRDTRHTVRRGTSGRRS